ncbi:putative protein kinase putative eukaryotic translation initiation factor 2-alpha kinase precursor [Leptomonas seymouri]|uniref:non-specific serine/threonine protein kinase n=1 Tax=Leptomonas seymouri TaxID=5684 RepID=A0A0N1I8U7_LEPSE|nr:putative protein kinase putative eukaryotic translation initiation factor 2-alpha kinase precursor [Leptomonas seymouri]|eukprot:KPI90463.1 putative protein kinase putative eukaryotic translation initiation factor 2-alpha kinase precursor [Leptomonas seymouri]
MIRDVAGNVFNARAFNTWANADGVQLRHSQVLRRVVVRVVVLLMLLLLACSALSVRASVQRANDAQPQFFTGDAIHSVTSALSEDYISPSGNEVALRYTFGGRNLGLVLSEHGFLHAYDLESGKLLWSADVGGDMISVEVEMPPSRDMILRDPLALPFLVRGNSLFTRIPLYTYNPTPPIIDTVELPVNLPDFLRPYFFMNISTLLRRQTVFFCGTDIFVTTSAEFIDLDSSTGHHIPQQHCGRKRRGKRNAYCHAQGGRGGNTSSVPVHNELVPILHVVRYNIVLHVVKAGEYSWSIMLSQLQLSPRTSFDSVYRRAAAAANSPRATAAEAGREEIKEHDGEANPRFFSHLMRSLFDYDAEHSGNSSGKFSPSTERRAAAKANFTEEGTDLQSEVATAAIIEALGQRRSQVAEYVSRALSLQQLNKSHIQLRYVLDNTAMWTATLPSPTRTVFSFDMEKDDLDGEEAPPLRGSLASAQAVASYVWVSGADSIFRIPVQRSVYLGSAAAKEAGEYAVYVESSDENIVDAQRRLRLTSTTFASALMPTQRTTGDLQLVPFLHQAGNVDMSQTAMAMDVEGDEREGAELDRYYHERSWWEPHFFSSPFPSEVPGAYNVGNSVGGYSTSEEVLRTGLAWRTAGIFSFHVLCLAGSIAFLCAGVPPRHQLQRAWAQADRNRDRLSHNSVSRPQSTRLMPQDLMSGCAGGGDVRSPFSPVIGGFPVDSPAQRAIDATMGARSASPARLDESDSVLCDVKETLDLKAGKSGTAPPQTWDDRTPEEVYAMMHEESEEECATRVEAGSATVPATEGKVLSASRTVQRPRRSLIDPFPRTTTVINEHNAAQSRCACTSPNPSSSDDDSEEIDMGERWWLRAQLCSHRPSATTLDETMSDKVSSARFSSAPDATEEEGKLFQLHFKVLEKIGFGGEGCVFCVEHRVTHARYAIKAILIHEQDEERVVQEAVLHSSFDHANVVRFYFCWIEDIAVSTADRLQLCNVGEDGMDTMSLGCSDRSFPMSSSRDNTLIDEDKDDSVTGATYHMLFIQMEYFSRGTLADWLRSRKGFYRLEVLQYMRNIVDGLVYLHNQDVVHRDLKPTNIFVSNANVLKIGDFGLAKRRMPTTNSSSDLASNVVGLQQERSVVGGSPLYCSPEQTRGDAVNKPSDIFSFGIIAVEMLCTFTTLHERIRILTDAQQGVLPVELEESFPEEAQIIKPLLASEPPQRPPLRRVQRQLTRLISTLEDSEQDAEDVPHSPAETAVPSQLVVPVSQPIVHATQVPVLNPSCSTEVIACGECTGSNSSLSRPSTAETVRKPGKPATADIVHSVAATRSASLTAPLPASCYLEHQDTAGELSLPRWPVILANSLPSSDATSSLQKQRRPDQSGRQGSVLSANSAHFAKHRNSYHDRRYASSSSSPGAEAVMAAANISNAETMLQRCASLPPPAELIVTDPYGPPRTPVTYMGDADLSSILKRDLQDRSIPPPD